MRLLYYSDGKIKLTKDLVNNIPEYAILSHTWGLDTEEVTFKDLVDGTGQDKPGFAKIEFCGRQAKRDSLDHFWVDTCCIDKSNNTELSEAINSMFRWYQNSARCYVYLSDVPSSGHGDGRDAQWQSEFRGSRWFTRGWTLQELVAPECLDFYSSAWSLIGSRQDLAAHIEERTGIPCEVLTKRTSILDTSIAQRMSWAAGRQTSRVEDLSYCLMGIFDVNMPMLYGEGEKAFIRLQKKIIKSSDDMSIFAWTDPRADFSAFRGLMAQSPSEFADCRNIAWTTQSKTAPYHNTHKGIEISLQLKPRAATTLSHQYVALLHGVYHKTLPGMIIGLYLQQVGDNQYARVEPNQTAIIPEKEAPEIPNSTHHFFVRPNIIMEIGDHARAASIVLDLRSQVLNLTSVRPADGWDDGSQAFYFFDPKEKGPVSLIFLSEATHDLVQVDIDLRKPWDSILEMDKNWKRRQGRTPQGSLTQTLQYRKTRHPVVDIVVARRVVGSQASVLVKVSTGS